jgi:hypothetical protein
LKKLIKVVGVVVVVLVLLVVGVVVFAIASIDGIARRGVENGASYALAVPTTLDKAKVGLRSGTFEMEGLTVANPEGFASPHFLKLNAGGLAVTVSSLSQETVEIPLLSLTGIDVNLQRAGGKANYAVIMDNLKRFEGGGGGSGGGEKPAKTFVIRKIEIRDINAHVALAPGVGKTLTTDVAVPEIILADVGSGGEPLSMADLTSLVVKTVLSSIVQVGGDLIPSDIAGEINGRLAQLTSLNDMGVGSISELGDKASGLVQDAAGDASAKIDDAAKEAEKKLKGLLGGGDG